MRTQNTVFIIDDDPMLRKTLSDILRVQGYEVSIAAKGQEILESIEEELPDVALIDLKLEDMSGLQLMRRIMVRSPHTQCIVLTGHASQASAIEAINLGAYSYLQKPCNIDQLLLTMRRAIERQEAEKALHQSQRTLSTLMSNLPGMAYSGFIDRNWTMLFVSEGSAELTGYAPAELINNHTIAYADLIHAEDREMVWESVQTAVAAGCPFQLVYRIVARDGQEKWVWEQGREVELSEGAKALEGFITDISERVQAENAEHEQRALAEALADTAAALSSTLDLTLVMKRILENVGNVVPNDAANIMHIEGDFARIRYWTGYPKEHTAFITTHRFPLETANLREMQISGKPILISDTSTYPDWIPLPEISWVHSYVAVPILAHGKVIGFLNLDSATPGFFNSNHVERLQVFADQVAIAIENAQIYEVLEAHSQSLERAVEDRTAELNQSTERVEAVVNSSSDAILILETNAIIRQANPAFSDMFGYTPEEVYQQPLAMLVTPESEQTFGDSLFSTSSSGEAQRFEIVALRKDGSTFDADMAISPIIGKTNLSDFVCSLRDITQRKQVEIKLRETLEQEKELSELKSRFVSMTSHEFRTPMTTILSSAFLLEKNIDKLTPEQKQRHFGRIKVSINNMNQLLDDILVIGKAEAGRLDFNPTTLDLEEFCQDAIAAAHIEATANLDIVFTKSDPRDSVKMDEKLMRHILTNLLSNAVKYSPEGGTVYVDLQYVDQNTLITVKDEGIGIPKADQDRLFEPFHRAQNVGTIHGTGLGLAIMKRAVDLHGGTISVESEDCRGTTFVITIPDP